MPKILVLVAGNNSPSNSETLADAFMNGIKNVKGMETEKIKIHELTIKEFSIDFYDPQCSQEEDFCRLQKLIEESNGVVFATPIWNFSVPGHLKNLIDRMGSFALDASRTKGTLKGKPFYFIYSGGAPMVAWKALMHKTVSHMPESIRYFGGTPIDSSFEPKCTNGPGKFELVVDKRPASLSIQRKHGEEFARIVERYAKDGSLPAGKKLWNKLMSIGGTVLKKVG